MYFLTLTPGTECNFLSSRWLIRLSDDFPGKLACFGPGAPPTRTVLFTV